MLCTRTSSNYMHCNRKIECAQRQDEMISQFQTCCCGRTSESNWIQVQLKQLNLNNLKHSILEDTKVGNARRDLVGDCRSTSFRLLLLRPAQGAAPEDEARVPGAARGVLVAFSLLLLRLAHGGSEVAGSWGIRTGRRLGSELRMPNWNGRGGWGGSSRPSRSDGWAQLLPGVTAAAQLFRLVVKAQ